MRSLFATDASASFCHTNIFINNCNFSALPELNQPINLNSFLKKSADLQTCGLIQNELFYG